MLVLLLAATGTALATGLGVIPVSLLGRRVDALRPALWGLAGGVMTVASIVGLLEPAFDEGSTGAVISGMLVGIAFLVITRGHFRAAPVHVAGLREADVRTAALVFVVLFAHSLPEGFAIGTAYASNTAGLGVFVILAIAIQNVPEGTSVAIPMEESGFTAWQQFWAAVATSLPQPIGAAIAFVAVDQVSDLLPASFGFAAGAMLALVALEMAPEALRSGRRDLGLTGAAIGAGVMLGLGVLLNV